MTQPASDAGETVKNTPPTETAEASTKPQTTEEKKEVAAESAPAVTEEKKEASVATALPAEKAAPADPKAAPAATPAPAKKGFFGLHFGGGKKKDTVVRGKLAKAPNRLSYIGLGHEREALIQNLATLLNAGLPLVDCLDTLRMETRTKPMKAVIQRMIDAVESGSTLWRAMDAQNFFTPYAVALVRIGEEAGNLARNMEYLAEQQEKDSALKSKVKMAMIYPAIVLVLVFIVVIGLGGFVLPNLIPVLRALGTELPLMTRVVISVSDFFTKQGLYAIPLSIVGMVALILLHMFTKFKIVTQWVIFHIPGIGSLAREATIARFGVILGGLLKAGVPLVEALNSLTEVTWIMSYRNFYRKLTDGINLGQSFQKSFQSIRGTNKLLPVSVQSLVIVGEKSGSLADILLKISDIYDRKASETAQKLPVILEPMLLIFMGGLVGTIAFAIIMPIYSVVGNIGH
jgi:type IV pilus assembly protein PilC